MSTPISGKHLTALFRRWKYLFGKVDKSIALHGQNNFDVTEMKALEAVFKAASENQEGIAGVIWTEVQDLIRAEEVTAPDIKEIEKRA